MSKTIPDVMQVGEVVLVERNSLTIELHRYGHGIRALNVSDAGMRGKICQRVSVDLWEIDTKGLGLPCDIYALVVELVVKAAREGLPDSFELAGFKFHFEAKQASRVFPRTKAGLKKAFKPLDAIPTKWTLPHAIRALVNGQYESLQCKYVLTDDYAFDNAVNFRKGAIADASSFARDIFESPSGWWTSLDATTGAVNICCHSFDSNSFRLKI